MSQDFDDLIDGVDIDKKLRITSRTRSRYENQPDGLPFIKVGRRKLYRLSSVMDWLASKEVYPNRRRSA